MNLGFYQRIGTQGTQDHTCITGRLEVEKPHQSSLLPSPMPLKKTKKKKRRLESIAALYTEDIGTEGVKKSSMATGALHQGSNFHLPLTEDEENRRRKRMVRQLQQRGIGILFRTQPRAKGRPRSLLLLVGRPLCNCCYHVKMILALSLLLWRWWMCLRWGVAGRPCLMISTRTVFCPKWRCLPPFCRPIINKQSERDRTRCMNAQDC